MKTKTDWKRVDAMTDKDIAKQIAEDPDVAPDMTTVNWPRVRGSQVLPTKKSVTIRLSQQVIDHFKKDGKGWQTRLNDFLWDKIVEEKSELQQRKNGGG